MANKKTPRTSAFSFAACFSYLAATPPLRTRTALPIPRRRQKPQRFRSNRRPSQNRETFELLTASSIFMPKIEGI